MAQAIRNFTKDYLLMLIGDRPHPHASRSLKSSTKTYLNFQTRLRFCNMASNKLNADKLSEMQSLTRQC
ncbi:MAG: hypothetical protein HC879_22395 [Leptolyngbyaceae cyanobacterium SL_5_9]|nr:hypothetical protein [Leptolyngbyaceae cyanobacterium SL_5_9]NJO75848.1 hypothetical protein [Leptolyngbyaceae cyanobacterium RM1_406_9]